MIAIDKSNPANAGMSARLVIQVRSISAAVALSRRTFRTPRRGATSWLTSSSASA